MNNYYRTTRLGIAGIAAIGLLAGCPGGGGGGATRTQTNNNGPAFNGPAAGFGRLAGQVVDVAGRPLIAARVSVGSTRSASTDENGFFSFEGLDEGTAVVKIAKSGFAPSAKRVVVSGDAAVSCVMLAEAGPPQMIDPRAAQTIQAADSMVSISAGSLAMPDGSAVTDPVQVVVTKIDPSTPDVMTFPGSFEDAMNMAGVAVQLESFGFATYELTCNGQTVDLAPGQTATIEYILPDNSQDLYNIGDVIPRWEFDEDAAMWVQRDPPGTIQLASDGSGRKAWVALVEHFSSWNCDAPLEQKNCLAGLVVDDTGGPVTGASVTAVGLSYNGTSSDMTDASGRFCVDVKRGAMVRLEVRVNGSAVPLAVRTVSVPDSSASCETGGCMEVSPSLSVAFDSCVRGRITDRDGNPVANETVYVVPGETVRTDSNGEYCARAPGGLEVFVFALGHQSIKVRTPLSAACPSEACVQADLTISLPGEGDRVGVAFAQKFTTLSPGVPGSPFTFFSLSGNFFAVDAEQDDFTYPGLTQQSETVGECTVITSTFTFTFDPNDPSSFNAGMPLGFVALDPGNPGVANNGTQSVNLLRGNPAQSDPPQPFLAGVYSPDPLIDLLALGFDAGQTIRFSWPGGADIGAFSDSIGVPQEIVVLSPDFGDLNLAITTNAGLDVRWVAGNASDTVTVLVSGSVSSSQNNPDGTFTTNSMSVTISCEFGDDGSGTVPATAMQRLPGPVTFISVARQRSRDIQVPLHRTGGTGIVLLQGQTSVGRSFAMPTP
jgi:hypothetical protein